MVQKLYVNIQTQESKIEDVCKLLVSMPGVKTANATTGLFDVVAFVETESEDRATEIVSRIRDMTEVEFATPVTINKSFVQGMG